MRSYDRSDYVRLAVFVVFIGLLISIYAYLHVHGLGGRHSVIFLRHLIVRAHGWGPLVIIALFALQTFIPIPNVVLAVMTGVLYGPVVGSIIVMIGLLSSALMSFYAGRYVGQHWIEARGPAWVKRYRDLLEERGYTMVLFMRLLQFPSDIVGALCGVTRMSVRPYLLATFFGMLPAALTFTILGRSWEDPRAWLFFVALFALSIGFAFLVRKTPLVKS